MTKTTTPTTSKPRRTDVSRLPMRWAGKGTSREGEMYRRVVRQLNAHVGGKPTLAQELLIARIAWIQVHLSRLDERALQQDEMSEHSGKQYLAWANSMSRMLQALGLQAAPKARTSLAEHLAAKAAPNKGTAP